MEMILPGSITGWPDVDLENAALDDFRPLYAILAGIMERYAVAGRGWWGDFNFIDRSTYGESVSGYQNTPTIKFLHQRIARAIYELAESFVNPEPALSFGINHGQDFPQKFTRFDIANSEHPLARLPFQGSTAATPEALALYRRFLADAKFWLGKFRYVYARNVGAKKRMESDGRYWTDENALAGDFASNISSSAVRRFRNGDSVYRSERSYSGRRIIHYDNDGNPYEVIETEQGEAEASETSGVWVGNPAPIPAEVFVLWGYGDVLADETQGHPGYSEAYSKRGAEVEEWKNVFGIWDAEERPVLEVKVEHDKTIRTRWEYSPDGTQSKTTVDESPAPTPGSGWGVTDSHERKDYLGEGWTYAVDARTDFGTVQGGENLLLLPEKNTLDLPAAPEKNAPDGSGSPWQERSWGRTNYVGPIMLHAVLDYGPHYKFP